MCGVGGEGLRGRSDGRGCLLEILVGDWVHCLGLPIRSTLGRNGEADVVEPLKRVGDDFVRTITSLQQAETSRK